MSKSIAEGPIAGRCSSQRAEDCEVGNLFRVSSVLICKADQGARGRRVLANAIYLTLPPPLEVRP